MRLLSLKVARLVAVVVAVVASLWALVSMASGLPDLGQGIWLAVAAGAGGVLVCAQFWRGPVVGEGARRSAAEVVRTASTVRGLAAVTAVLLGALVVSFRAGRGEMTGSTWLASLVVVELVAMATIAGVAAARGRDAIRAAAGMGAGSAVRHRVQEASGGEGGNRAPERDMALVGDTQRLPRVVVGEEVYDRQGHLV